MYNCHDIVLVHINTVEHQVIYVFSGTPLIRTNTHTHTGHISHTCTHMYVYVHVHYSHWQLTNRTPLFVPRLGGVQSGDSTVFLLFSCHSSKHAVPESGVTWTGATCQRHISLTANSLQTVRVFANFTKTGVYNLQNVKVWATQEGSTDYHIQRWQRTSLISVVEWFKMWRMELICQHHIFLSFKFCTVCTYMYMCIVYTEVGIYKGTCIIIYRTTVIECTCRF